MATRVQVGGNIDSRTFQIEVPTGAGKSGCTTLLPIGVACAFSVIFYDEGHHQPAPSWNKYRTHYHQARLFFLLTATTKRSDKQLLAGKLVYSLSLQEAALRDRIVRRPVFVELEMASKPPAKLIEIGILKEEAEHLFARIH